MADVYGKCDMTFMKIAPMLIVGLALALPACSDSNRKPAAPTGDSPESGSLATAPGDYLKSATKAEQSAEKTVDTAAIKKAIDLFNVQEGRFPKDLNELADKKYLPKIPTPPFGTKLEYDAAAGTVKLVKQ